MRRLRRVVMWGGALYIVAVASFALGFLWPRAHTPLVNSPHPSAFAGETPTEEEDGKISGGLRHSFTGRAGYHLQLFAGRIVFEPELRFGVRF